MARREDLVQLIDKKINLDSMFGVIVLDVGEKYLWYQWPHESSAPSDIRSRNIEAIRDVSWDEVEHKVLRWKGSST